MRLADRAGLLALEGKFRRVVQHQNQAAGGVESGPRRLKMPRENGGLVGRQH